MDRDQPETCERNDDGLTQVRLLVEDVCQEIADCFGVRPDLTVETLPLVDAYLRSVVAELPRPERDTRLGAVGAYFGEVARRKLEARWAGLAGDPGQWRVELSSCFLHFNPLGMAGESMVGCESAAYDGTFATLDELHDELDERLQRAPPMPEDEYFSLAGRMEILTQVADFLVSRALARAEQTRMPPPTYSAADYAFLEDAWTDPEPGV